MTYPAQNPMIPLFLTAVAAEPDMAVIIFIVGRDHYDSENWANFKIPTRDVQPRLFSVTGTNYRSLVSKRVDEAGAMAFVKEMADDASVAYNNAQGFVFTTDDNDALDYLATVLTSDKVLTRFYTRISGWEIADDPKFVPVPRDFATNIHDMSGRPSMDACAGNDPICGDRYCGQDAKCATTEFGEGCVCPEGGVLRRITNGFGVPLAICQESYFDMMASIEAMAAAQGIANPCDTYDCGTNGTCVVMNGFPTCDCNDGFAGVATGIVGVTCARIEDTFSSSQVLAGFTAQVADADADAGDGSGGAWCVASREILTAPNVAMVGLVVVLWRRRRRAPA